MLWGHTFVFGDIGLRKKPKKPKNLKKINLGFFSWRAYVQACARLLSLCLRLMKI